MIFFEPTVVNKYLDSFDIYIGRGSKWGNPYSHQQKTSAKYIVANRDEAIEMFELYMRGCPELIFDIVELSDKKLGCTCKPQKCHGDVLCKIFNKFVNSDADVDASIFW
jgi:hypothetical protein